MTALHMPLFHRPAVDLVDLARGRGGTTLLIPQFPFLYQWLESPTTSELWLAMMKAPPRQTVLASSLPLVMFSQASRFSVSN